MKTKEEILEIETRHEKFELGAFTKVYELAALSAMSIHAKEIAIGFATWADDNGWTQNMAALWESLNYPAGKTTEQLFSLYLKSIEA